MMEGLFSLKDIPGMILEWFKWFMRQAKGIMKKIIFAILMGLFTAFIALLVIQIVVWLAHTFGVGVLAALVGIVMFFVLVVL